MLVTGATGNVGRLVVDELLAAGATAVRALTNDPAKAGLPDSVDVVEGYLGRLETMRAALEGVDVLYLAPLPRTVVEVAALAAKAGVRRIVDLSASGADAEAAGDREGWHYYAVEHAVEESGIAWTHLRPGEFMTNATMWAGQIRAGDVVRDAHAEASTAPIALVDIAAVAARALLDDRYVGAKLTMTGPEAITRAEMVVAIGAALGREVRYEELTHEQAVEEMKAVMGEYSAWYYEGMDELARHPMPVSLVVEDVTGNPGTPFATWAVENAGLFR
ncbi:MAG: NAD(P)H-binding protein [Streptosporangiales bacterium]|nr:NAD(P)H-binding protein [Streptosporangiales bacterium]